MRYSQDSIQILRDLTGRAHVTLVGRAAAGIYAVLRALDLHDQWVLIPANTCYVVLWAVLRSGNKPFLVDVDPLTGNTSPETLSAFPHDKPGVVIPCHIYRLVAPIKSLRQWARARGVFVLEDATLALGGHADGQPAGAWGDASVFSFGQGKIVDVQLGGALLTDDAKLAGEVARLLSHAPVWDDHHVSLTNQWNALYWALHQYEADNPRLLQLYPALFNIYGELISYQLPVSYLHDLPQALQTLPANLAHRAQMAARYDDLLHGCPVRTPPRPTGSILWRYPLLVSAEHRNDLLQHLWEQGIHDATRWYPPLRHMLTALAPELPAHPTPGADQLGAEIINLRVDQGISQEEAARTVAIIRRYFEHLNLLVR